MHWLNWPNRITLVRILLVGPLVICLLNLNSGWEGWRKIALILFGVMAVSDGVDGYLARRLQAQTRVGGFLDPLADKLLVTCAVIILAIDATSVPGFRLPNWVTVVAIGKDLLTVLGFFLVYLQTGEFLIRPRPLGKACTMVQLFMVFYILVGPSLPRTVPNFLSVLSWLASGLAVATLADYVRIGNRFAMQPGAGLSMGDKRERP